MVAKVNVRWNNQVRITTIIVAFIVIFAEFGLFYKLLEDGNSSIIAIIVLFVFPLAFILNAPLSIKICESQFVLKKILGKVAVNYNQISIIKPHSLDSGDIRIFGSGGFGGFIGVFSNINIGKYYSYVGDPSQAFYIKTKNGKKMVFSCENYEFVIENIKKHVK